MSSAIPVPTSALDGGDADAELSTSPAEPPPTESLTNPITFTLASELPAYDDDADAKVRLEQQKHEQRFGMKLWSLSH